MGLGRIGSAMIVGMVLLVTLWFVALPFSLVDLWWQHHWGLGPFDVLAWLNAQWAVLAPRPSRRCCRSCCSSGSPAASAAGGWSPAPVFVAIAALVRVRSRVAARRPAASAPRCGAAADVMRLERIEHVSGTPVRVEDVSSWTSQANAFTVGFGPSTHVVVWNTLLDGRFTRGEEDVVLAHELGHVRSRHILKALGWSALVVLPTLWLSSLALRRRGGSATRRTCRTRSSCSRCSRS